MKGALASIFLAFSCVFFFSVNVANLSAATPLNLEKNTQDFVLELKKIQVEGYPHAFNPSIVRWKDSLLMSFWTVKEPCQDGVTCAAESEVGLVWLDSDFNPASRTYILDFGCETTRAQDLRLVKVGESLYIVYNDNQDELITEGGFRMCVARLEFENDHFYISDKEFLYYFDGECSTRREKNWVPFDYKGQLMLAYSLIPHVIFQPFKGTNCCQTVARTDNHFSWNWGEPRGGTPAVKIGNQYLSFFHSCIDLSSEHSQGKNATHYFIGAYTFSDHPPFEITKVSPKPIIAKGFYSGDSYDYYWKPVCAVFPCGILVEGEFVWMSYGRQDHEMWIAKMDCAKLLKSLNSTKHRRFHCCLW